MDPVDKYEAELVESSRLPSPRRFVRLGLALLPFAAWGACSAEVVDETTGLGLWLAAVAIAVVVAIGAIVALVRHEGTRGLGFAVVVAGFLSPVITFFMGIASSGGWTRGRALRRRGKAHVPETGTSHDAEDWVAPTAALDIPAAVATAWRANAATETASVAAFAHLANELLAVGAPARLVADAHADALDEIRHAQLCYGLAADIDGCLRGPAPFLAATAPAPSPTLATVAAESAVESCVLERASAIVAARLAEHPELCPRVREVLEEIADDEARHAEHGWAVLAWCRRRGGKEIDAAVDEALHELRPATMTGPVPDDRWERYGIAGTPQWRSAVAAARRELGKRLHAARATDEQHAAA
ncbi:MAG: hypothetical protein AAF721_21880 [Myxococcota bacterium]